LLQFREKEESNGENKGWVKLWREQFSHEISDRKPWCDGYAWSYLYARANYKAGIVNFRNQYIPVERGQFITSEIKLHEIFGWSRRRTNSFLTSLEVRGMCTIKRTKRFIVITICNYEKFQAKEEENETTDVTTDVTTDGQQVDTNKNDKKEKNHSPAFSTPSSAEIMEAYHRILPELPRISKWESGQNKKTPHLPEGRQKNAGISTGGRNTSNRSMSLPSSWGKAEAAGGPI